MEVVEAKKLRQMAGVHKQRTLTNLTRPGEQTKQLCRMAGGSVPANEGMLEGPSSSSSAKSDSSSGSRSGSPASSNNSNGGLTSRSSSTNQF